MSWREQKGESVETAGCTEQRVFRSWALVHEHIQKLVRFQLSSFTYSILNAQRTTAEEGYMALCKHAWLKHKASQGPAKKLELEKLVDQTRFVAVVRVC